MDGKLLMVLGHLSTFKYGMYSTEVNGIIPSNEILDADATKFMVQDTDSFLKYHSGTCHDVSIIVSGLCKRFKVEHTCVFLASHKEPNQPTHSFVVVTTDNKNFSVIDVFSYPEFGGIMDKTFSSLEEAIRDRTNQWIESDNDGNNNIDIYALENFPAGGIGYMEWWNDIVDNNKMNKYSISNFKD